MFGRACFARAHACLLRSTDNTCVLLQAGGEDAKAYDHTRPMLVFSGIAASIAIFTTIFFRPKYKRLIFEKQAAATSLNMKCALNLILFADIFL